MDKWLNLPMLSNPYNWVIVWLMVAIFVASVTLIGEHLNGAA
jgi:hypothetical protein